MKKQITDKDAIGKIVENIGYSYSGHAMVITFNDGTFTSFEIQRGYETYDDEISNEEIDAFKLDENLLIGFGIATKKEKDDYREKIIKNNHVRAEQQEKKEYERLRAKFNE